MSQPSPNLLISLQKSIADRARDALTVFCLDDPLPSSAPDLFSNDYLSLSTDRVLRDTFSRKVQAAPRSRLFGSTGSRLATGNSGEIIALEKALSDFFRSPSALLFNSGFNANVAFFATVPQKNDIIIYDEAIHASCREGIRLSSRPAYRFAHNAMASFEECLLGVLQKHPQITRGTSTVFVIVESLYSMDGDFCPLTEIVGLVEILVPPEHAHIVVDEAHTSGICGPNGAGYVSGLGLNDRVHTKIHGFGKGWGFCGAVVLTSPIIRNYLINFAQTFIFSTSMPYTTIYALESCLGVISSAHGKELRRNLHHLSHYAHQKLFTALKNVPDSILAVNKLDVMTATSDHGFCSPIMPVFAPSVARLAGYLLQKGYAVTPGTYPIVKRSRIRLIIHAGNTKEEIDSFTDELLAWVKQQEFLPLGGTGGSEGARESYVELRAKL